MFAYNAKANTMKGCRTDLVFAFYRRPILDPFAIDLGLCYIDIMLCVYIDSTITAYQNNLESG